MAPNNAVSRYKSSKLGINLNNPNNTWNQEITLNSPRSGSFQTGTPAEPARVKKEVQQTGSEIIFKS